MDNSKLVMLKATVAQLQTISVGYIKNILNVDTDEAEDMLQGLIQAGVVEPYPIDGVNHRVIH